MKRLTRLAIKEKEMSDFNIGDVVKLKSGGPSMTVHDSGDYSPAGSNPGLLCVWFDGAKKFEEVFHPRVLEKNEREWPSTKEPF
jgi:uncharacterized protein YodC (DUF2158 family)